MKWIAAFPNLRDLLPRRKPLGIPTHLPGAMVEKSAETIRLHWQKLALLGLFGLGLFLGARMANGSAPDWQAQLVQLLRSERFGQAQQSLLGNALGYFFADGLFLLAAYLFGLCAAGLPFVLALPVIRGLGLGAVSGWLFAQYGLSGLGYSILVLFPSAVLSMLVMLAACKESMLMSGDMLLIASGKSDRVESNFRMFTARYFVLLLLCAGAAILDAACFRAFSGMFPAI
ncbi:MAG: stage II sporulation protein M [Oscillospiraceae bacterium]|nr:stage II sporulation protein M [Oscillospiraceae bacterium]